MNPDSSKRQLIITAAVIIILVAVAAGVMAFSSRQSQTETASNTTSPASSPDTNASPAVAGEATPAGSGDYKDGTYTAVGSYRSPGGNEKITISLTVKDGVVTDTTAQPGSTNPTGQQYQGQFASGYKAMVVGQSLDSLNLSKVSGSSLTPQGFNDAVSQIKSQAQA